MPVSQRKRAANRRNARKSTGPRTAAGKAVVSRNAVTHGFCARDIVINSPHLKEDPDEYERLVDSLAAELCPATDLQSILVRKIATCLWRQQRAIRAETAYIDKELDNMGERVNSLNEYPSQYPEDFEAMPDTPEQETLDRNNIIGTRLIPDDTFGVSLLRYQTQLDREMTRALALLKQLQAVTAPGGSHTPPPRSLSLKK
jgi:hypothetical protein